jgi:hypothetical protein
LFAPFPLSSTQLAIAAKFGARLLNQGLLPETEINDGKIPAQTSMMATP